MKVFLLSNKLYLRDIREGDLVIYRGIKVKNMYKETIFFFKEIINKKIAIFFFFFFHNSYNKM
jgi:hypothetical protein